MGADAAADHIGACRNCQDRRKAALSYRGQTPAVGGGACPTSRGSLPDIYSLGVGKRILRVST